VIVLQVVYLAKKEDYALEVLALRYLREYAIILGEPISNNKNMCYLIIFLGLIVVTTVMESTRDIKLVMLNNVLMFLVSLLGNLRNKFVQELEM
jgi:hypothetical protein